MFLQELYLKNFRSYKESRASFVNGVNFIQGSNATGKTNLLEAIYFLSTGRSFRTSHLFELIRKDAPHFQLEAKFIKHGISHTIKLSFDGKERYLDYNQTIYSNFTSLLGLLPTIVYAPEDLFLINGSPLERRRFLNLHLAQLDPQYIYHLARYTKALKQRNYLLRTQDERTCPMWEEIMATSASYMIQKRLQAIQELNDLAQKKMLEFSGQEELLEIEYRPLNLKEIASKNLAHHLLDQFAKCRKRELAIGSSLIGPHRDDLSISIDGKFAKAFASEGQKRCCLASLRLAEWDRFAKILGEPPLISIDDFGAHLDEIRKKRLSEHLHSFGQVFLTSPSFPNTHDLPLCATKLLTVDEGNIY